MGKKKTIFYYNFSFCWWWWYVMDSADKLPNISWHGLLGEKMGA